MKERLRLIYPFDSGRRDKALTGAEHEITTGATTLIGKYHTLIIQRPQCCRTTKKKNRETPAPPNVLTTERILIVNCFKFCVAKVVIFF